MPSPSTAVAVIIMHENKVLIGERITQQGNCWQLPGGFINLGETPTQAMMRESFEETNLTLKNEQLIALTNNVFSTTEHTVSLIFKAHCTNPTELNLNEKNKCRQWLWKPWDKLPQPLFLPLQILVDNRYHPFCPFTLSNKANNCFIF